MENISKPEGGCGAWCCETQNPQLLHCEFVNAWRWVNENWDQRSVIQLIASAIRNFLMNTHSKGCIFWDKKTKLCTQHETRPFNCRIYGITPDEEFRPRYEKLKVVYPEAREQCNLIKTKDGRVVTKGQTDAWWKMLVDIEANVMGIARSRINDKAGGTYRTFHDHIMLALYDRDKLSVLSKMRVSDTPEQKERFVQLVVEAYEKKVTKDGSKEVAQTGEGQKQEVSKENTQEQPEQVVQKPADNDSTGSGNAVQPGG